MLDWQKLVREQLAGSDLGHQEEDEVVAELAGHLEEAFESFCREGISEQDATRRALAQVADWNALRRKIYLARNKEDNMEPRVTRFWLPGLLGFALAMILEAASSRFDSHPLVLSLDRDTPPILRFHISWIVALLLVGALAAYLSRRAGGTLRTSLLSSIFPVVPFAAVYLIAIPGLVIGHPIAYIVAEKILYMALGWVVAPAAALLTGGLFVQRFLSGGSRSSQGVNAGVA